MKSRAVLLFALVLAVGGVLWLVLGGGEGRGPVDSVPVAPSREHTVARAAELDEPRRASEVVESATPEARQRTAAPTREELLAGDQDGFATEDAQWVEVDVRLPAGLPADDTVALVVFSSNEGEELEALADRLVAQLDSNDLLSEPSGKGIVWARREIAASGSIRLPLAPDAPDGVALLRSRYVHAPAALLVPPEADTRAEPVTIQGELGAWVTGRCRVPDGVVEPEGIELSFGSGFFGADGELREVSVAEDFTFEVRALSAGERYVVHAAAEKLVDHLDLRFEVSPGEHRELEIPLPLGATIAGRVRGPSGEPVPGARIEAQMVEAMWFGQQELALAGDDGAFSLSGLEAGEVVLQVTAEGWLDRNDIELEVAEGQRLEGYDIVLERGNRVDGVVRWPDGRPAVAAEVTASSVHGNGWRMQVGATESDEDGRFELSGLVEGPFEVRAEADPDGDGPPAADRDEGWADDLSDLHIGPKPTVWKAVAVDVAGNTSGLELTLSEPLGLRGRVVDDTGAPVAKFAISASPTDAPGFGRSDTVTRGFESEDGTFLLAGFFPGEWAVGASSVGYSPTPKPVDVAIPQVGAPVVLTLERGVALAGIVVDPFGKPVEDAEVTAGSGGDSSFEGTSRSSNTTSDDAGRFVFESVARAGLVLSAEHEDWAPSEELPIDLAPGEGRDDLVLALRLGGTITGEVYDDEGNPDAGQQVSAGEDNFGFGGGEPSAVTDEAGRFVIEHVPPGRVVVSVMPDEGEILEAISEAAGEETAMINFMGQIRMETLDVADGETVHVVLGHRPKAPVRVHGRVTEADGPVSEAQVYAIEEGGAILQGIKAARTDEDGRYEIVVDRPGDFVITVGLEGFFGEQSIPFYVDVPEAEAFELDLELPLGRVSGRVTGPDGSPANGVSLSLSRSGGVLGMEDVDRSNARSTDVDGLYTFTHLHPGRYELRVGGGFEAFFMEGADRFGATVVDGIEVGPDESVDGVDVELELAGELTGVVSDAAGRPVGGAAIFVRDAAGRVVSNVSACVTGADGRFRYPGLAPGEVTVCARSDELASPDSAPVEIVAGQTTDVDLVVGPASILIVTVLEEGEPVRARVVVRDAQGRQMNGLVSMDGFERFLSDGFSSRERRVGPVPPGRYELVATTDDGKKARKSVSVREGQRERPVKLRLR